MEPAASLDVPVLPARGPEDLLAYAGHALGRLPAGSLLLKQPLTSAVRARLPLVLTVMHMSWGAGFIVGLPAPRAQ